VITGSQTGSAAAPTKGDEMNIRNSALALSLVAIVAACGGYSSERTGPGVGTSIVGSSDDVTLTINTANVKVGDQVAFTFANNSDDTLTTGALDCVNHYERLEGDEWKRIESLRACIMLAQIHSPGSSSDHTTPAPEAPGRYRLVVEAGSASGKRLAVKSAEFTVAE
jgi:plastocyanin